MGSGEIKKLILEVLEKGYLMSLGTHDEGGVWVCDVIYIFDDDLNIFWMSSPDTRHSKAILKNNYVVGTITVNLPKKDNLGIQFEGMAQKIEGAKFDLAKKHYQKRNRPKPKEEDDVLGGSCWYQLSPGKIELIHEKLFGFAKQQFINEKNL